MAVFTVFCFQVMLRRTKYYCGNILLYAPSLTHYKKGKEHWHRS